MMAPRDHVVFVTGKLARGRLERVAATLPSGPVAWTIADAGSRSRR
jgi:hypothetical protein